jgi:hypothetical protein
MQRVIGGVAVVIIQPHPVLPQLLPDELVVDGHAHAPELRQTTHATNSSFASYNSGIPAKEGAAMTLI